MWLVLASAFATPRDLDAGLPTVGRDDDEQPLPVVGGAPAPPGAWPDAVALYAGGLFACSGVLVAPDLVLTAGHCQYALDEALIGTTDLRSGGERVGVVEVIAHDEHTETFDVALVRLARPVSARPHPPALDCVASEWLVDGAEVDVVGFGATDEWASEFTTRLHEARTTVSDADCSDLAVGCNEAVSPDGELVAGGEGVDSCAGDSGGPLYLQTQAGPYLAGITSRAAMPAATPCGGGGIYVRVDAIAGWIEEVGQVTLERPTCEGWNHAPEPTGPASVTLQGGEVVAVELLHGDPDGDAHSWSITQSPALVDARVSSDGVLVLAAPPGASGDDEVVIEVTDDGQPPLTGEVRIPIAVRPLRGVVLGGGCATAPGSAWLLVLLLGRRRR